MLAYSWEIEISRILHNYVAIAWGILGVMVLELLLITDYYWLLIIQIYQKTFI